MKMTVTYNEAEMARITDKLRALGIQTKPSERRKIIMPAAKVVADAAKQLVPVSAKPVKRYKDGKLVAVYHPGHLRRSVRVLTRLGRKTGTVYVGALRAKGDTEGVFKGARVDGWYAAIVEKLHKPFLRPAFDANRSKAESMIINGLKQKLQDAIR